MSGQKTFKGRKIMGGKNAGLQLGDMPKKNNSMAAKVCMLVHKRHGQRISETEMFDYMDSQGIGRYQTSNALNNCVNIAGRFLGVKDDHGDKYYFLPKKEDISDMKDRLRDAEEKGKLIWDYYVQNIAMPSRENPNPLEPPSGKAGNQGITSLKQQIENVEEEIKSLEETNQMLESLLNSCNDSQESFVFKKQIDDNDKTIGVKTKTLRNLKQCLEKLEQLAVPA